MLSATRTAAAVAAIAVVAPLEKAAFAFHYASAISDGCHEAITGDALREVRRELSIGPQPPPSRDEAALMRDLPFTLDADLGDLGAAALLLASRDNDLKGRDPLDSGQLAVVHGDPNRQAEHCLRRPEQDEPTGAFEALRDCAGYIRAAAGRALDGLDAAGAPDPAASTTLSVYLPLRGAVDAALPAFYVEMGRAVHGLQDSFSHTLRTADGLRVRTVLNWVDFAEERLDEGRDGPAHRHALDRCDLKDAGEARRRNLATRASTELLRIALDPMLARADKAARVDRLLVTYLTLEPGCTSDNRWCDAAELSAPPAVGCGCHLAGRRTGARRGQ